MVTGIYSAKLRSNLAVTMLLKYSIIPACIVLTQTALSSYADDSIFDLSLAELAQVSVSISSKVELPINLSPATVSAYNQNQLFKEGIQQLADLADITPGFSSYSLYGERIFETRGQKAASFENNKHLVLLDGIRINHARANKAPIDNELPLWMVNKLELLRGPASALYGQSAFFGVVSLDSAFNKEDDFSAQVNYQTTQKGRRANVKGNIHSSFGHSYFAYSHFDNESHDAFVGPNYSPLQKYYDDQESEFIYARQHYKTSHLGQYTLGYIELNRQSGLGEHWSGDFSIEDNNIQWLTKISYLQWRQNLSNNLHASIKLVNNDSIEEGIASNVSREQVILGDAVTYDRYRVNVNAKLMEAELNWQIAHQQSFIVGASIDQRQEQGDFFATGFTIDNLQDVQSKLTDVEYFPRSNSDKKNNQSLYFQYYDLLSDWGNIHVTAGVRYDRGEYLSDDFSQWSPRIALVKSFNVIWTIKGSYSSALRAPSLKEYLLNDETKHFINNEALNSEQALIRLPEQLLAETINSTELSLLYQDENMITKFNAFYNQTANLLNGQGVFFKNKEGKLVSKNSFFNSGQKFSLFGGEVELQWRFTENWQLSGFMSKAIPKSDSVEASRDIPKFKSSISLTGEFTWFTLHLMQIYHADIEGEVNHISRVDLTLSKRIELLNNTIEAYCKFVNLFEEDNYYAVNGVLANPLPQRTIELGLSYSF